MKSIGIIVRRVEGRGQKARALIGAIVREEDRGQKARASIDTIVMKIL